MLLRSISAIILIFMVLGLLQLYGEEPARGEKLKGMLCNFHGHALSANGVFDDGKVTLADLLFQYKKDGYDVVFWTPHSDSATSSEEKMKSFQAFLNKMPLKGNGILGYLGMELTVENGPNYTSVMGYSNNNHMGIIGARKPMKHGMKYKAACEYAHSMRAFAIINHPGPGPAEWEPDYWTKPELLRLADGMECYNGQLTAISMFEDDDYRFALSKGMRLFPTGSTDAHKQDSPLDCHTLVFAAGNDLESIREALAARRTVALCRMAENPPLTVSRIGEVVTGEGEIELSISFAKEVEMIRLYRFDKEVKTWNNTKEARYEVDTSEDAAWSWFFRDARGRGQTAAVWTQKEAPAKPDFAIFECDGVVFVSNMGGAKGKCEIAGYSAPPFCGGKEVQNWKLELRAEEQKEIALKSKDIAYLVVNHAGYEIEDAPPKEEETNYCNNSLLLYK